MIALAATSPTTGQTIYLALERDGTPVCDPDLNEAELWEDMADLLRWADRLPEAILARIASRPGLKVIEVIPPSLIGVTPADLAELEEFLATQVQRTKRLPKRKRTA